MVAARMGGGFGSVAPALGALALWVLPLGTLALWVLPLGTLALWVTPFGGWKLISYDL